MLLLFSSFSKFFSFLISIFCSWEIGPVFRILSCTIEGFLDFELHDRGSSVHFGEMDQRTWEDA